MSSIAAVPDSARRVDARGPDQRGNLRSPATAAALLVGVETAALLAIAVVYIVKTLTGHPHDVGAALSTAGIAIASAALFAVLSRALMAHRLWSRSPVVVVQIVLLPVGFSLTFQAGRPAYGAPILLAALGVLYLLATPDGRAAFRVPGR